MSKMERIAHEIPGVKHTQAMMGSSILLSANGPNFGSMFVILDSFDKASKKRLQNASFLVGNVFRAVRYATQFRLGSLVSFVDHNGFRHRGVLINRQAEKKLNSIAVRVETLLERTRF